MSHPELVVSLCITGRWCFEVGGFGPERCLCHGSHERSLSDKAQSARLLEIDDSCLPTTYPTPVVGDSCPCEEQTIHQSSRLSSQAGSSHTAETTSHQGDQATQITRHSAGRTGRPGPTQVICHRLIELRPQGLASAGSTKPCSPNEAGQPQRNTSSRPLEALSHPPTDSVQGQVTSSVFPTLDPRAQRSQKPSLHLCLHTLKSPRLAPRQKLGGHVRATVTVWKLVKEERVSDEFRFSLSYIGSDDCSHSKFVSLAFPRAQPAKNQAWRPAQPRIRVVPGFSKVRWIEELPPTTRERPSRSPLIRPTAPGVSPAGHTTPALSFAFTLADLLTLSAAPHPAVSKPSLRRHPPLQPSF